MAVDSSSTLAWWPLPAWINPSAAAWLYFLVLNVLVGAIAVTSSRAQPQSRRRRLCRSASSMVLDRLRSFSVFSVSEAVEELAEMVAASPDELVGTPPAAAVALASGSVVEEDGMEAEETPVTMSSNGTQVLGLQSHAVPVPESQSSPRQPPAAADVAVATAEAATSPVRRRPSKVAGLANAKPKRRQSQAYAEAAEGKAELNERAEQFIRQFKQELRLQRINSVLGAAARL
nr:unnamed protein product [Digitaria exilis]